jgi:hypothetical protein
MNNKILICAKVSKIYFGEILKKIYIFTPKKYYLHNPLRAHNYACMIWK